MTARHPPGRLIGAVRAADVYELDRDRVPRRYRTPFDVGREARLMSYVMLTANGPVVIDWSNALAGPAGVDVAMAALIMRTGARPRPPGCAALSVASRVQARRADNLGARLVRGPAGHTTVE
jgi:hypothetical protein